MVKTDLRHGNAEQEVAGRVQIRVAVGAVFDERPKLRVGLQPTLHLVTAPWLRVNPLEEIPPHFHPVRIPAQGQPGQTDDLPELLVDVVDLDLQQGAEQVEKGDLRLESTGRAEARLRLKRGL